MNPIANKIEDKFPQYFKNSVEYAGDLGVSIKKEGILEVCKMLHDDPDLKFDYIIDICSVDFLGESERFDVVYLFYSIEKRQRIRINARVREDEPNIDSVCSIWQGANFMEREVFDMMGIVFNNHPDLRRILMTDDFVGYPLRKDFPLKGRGWREELDLNPKSNGG